MRIVVVDRRDVESLFRLFDSMAANACEGENAVLRCYTAIVGPKRDD